ncbi:MAG: 16S rRNA (guanine(966)-N(2))-methyltransferase RsmD [Dehalococcoidales bacterium]|nr:16S rRNA (guanine(966)-N(2))-methyltransferase RsmD [Dehalococcoidales bacterium]
MRVITGEAKGMPLKVPKGTPTRPATELVRGAIFSILENMTDDWDMVLDLFSGSGALGIEALSRGAGWVDFVEQRSKSCAIIRENLAKTKLEAQAHIYCCRVTKALSFLDKEYSIILMDPPYSDSSIGTLVAQLATTKLVGAGTVLVVTHSSHLSLKTTYDPIKLITEHRHGDSCIAVYQKEDNT